MFRNLRKTIRNRWKQFQSDRAKALKAKAKIKAKADERRAREESARKEAEERKRDLKAKLDSADVIRLMVGASGLHEDGWISTEVETLNLLREKDWQHLFRPDSIDMIFAEHVWEHLTAADGLTAATLCHRYLKPGGHLRIAIPDGLHPDPDYIDHVRVGGSGPGADDHKVLYTHEMLTIMLRKAGFEPRLLEYFDEQGQFHAVDWDPRRGMVRRSKRFDPRNAGGVLSYTSLIADAVKRGG